MQAQWTSNTTQSKKKKKKKSVCPFNTDQNEGPGLLGVPFMRDGLLNEHKIWRLDMSD